MLKAVRLLNLRRLRHHPMRSVLAVLAIAGGVAMGCSLLVVTESFQSSYADFGRALGGPAPLRIVGATARAGLDEGVVPAVERTPGVAAAVPVVQAVTLADRGDGVRRDVPVIVALGADCRVEVFVGAFGCDPAAIASARDTDLPLVSTSLVKAVGPHAELRTDAGRLPLDGAPTSDRLDAVRAASVVVFPLPVAQRLFARPHRVDAIYVKPAPGTDLDALKQRLASSVGDWNGVLRNTDPPPGATVILDGFLPLFSMLAVFGIGIAVVLVYDTVALTVEERRRDLAVVAAVGGTTRTVVGGTVAEASVLGLVGGLLGGLGALVLAGPILGSLSGFSERFTGVPLRVHGSATPFVVGAILGIVLAAVAAWLPARRAMKMDVAAELSNRTARDDAAPALRLRRALVIAGIGVASLVACWLAQRHGALENWQPPTGMTSVAIASAAFIIAAGAFAPIVLALLLRTGRRRGGAPARLGLANLVRDPGRTGTMAAAVAAPVAIAFIVGSFIASIHTAVEQNVTRNAAGFVRASTVPVNNSINIDAGLAPPIVERLRTLPGVERLDREAALLAGHERGQLIGVIGSDNEERFPFALYRGTKDPTRYNQGEVIVGPGLGRRLNLHEGSRLRLPTPTGWQEVTVQGVWDYGDFNGNSVSMPLWMLEKLYGPQPVRNVRLKVAPGVSTESVRTAVLAAHLDPAMTAQTPEELSHVIAKDIEGTFASFKAIQRALLLVAFVAVLATLLLVAVQRRRELALLAAVGMRPSELGWMVVLEALAVGVVGALLGVVFGIGMYTALHLVIPIFIGFHDPFTLNLASIPAAAIVTTLVVVIAASLPAWRTAKVEVVENLQYE